MDPDRATELLRLERERIESAIADLSSRGAGEEDEPGERDSEGLYQKEFDEGRAGDLREQLEAVERAEARLDEMIGTYGDLAAIKQSYKQNPEAMRQVENLALEDQVTDWVLANVTIHEVASTFKDIKKFEG